jgi:ATP-dependent DNA helicase RecQ
MTRQRDINFDALISEAVELLRGNKEPIDLAPDEVRDRLLAGYRHILVDEYQDIDQGQYDLISALAGRTLEDADSKLTILAVGDDDQNIYRFRGANVDFIRRFRSDYQANIHYLLDNYRSGGHIIAAANRLIADNRDRMKTDHPIHIDRARAGSPTGGRWEQRDPLTRGRVHCLQVRNGMEQAQAALSELERLRDCDGNLDWSDCTVLAWENQALAVERSLCEGCQIPFSWTLPADCLPPPFRIRENQTFLDWLAGVKDETRRASELIAYLDERLSEDPQNPWWQQLRLLLDDWRTETDDGLIPVTQTIEVLSEALAEQRRDRRFGHGLFLSTIHSAKGMEFKHVVILDGGFGKGKSREEREEERRLYYVAMTRARETLCLMQRQDVNNPFLAGLNGDFLLRRPYGGPLRKDASAAIKQYSVLSLQDLYLDFAGRRPNDDPVHSKLANLRPGSPLHCARDGNYLRLYDGETAVAALSKDACRKWRDRLDRIESVRVLAMIRWYRDGGDPGYSQSAQVESWEVPMVEVVHRAALR